jgi:hypothetical protein
MKKRRDGRSPAATETSGRRGRTGPMAAGLLSAVFALFMAPMSIRELATWLNHDAFVRDELELEFFSEGRGGHSSAWMEGHLVSTGERYRTDRVHVVGLDVLLSLDKERRLEGRRFPVWFLPRRGFWFALDKVVQFRVRSDDEFAQGLPAGLIAFNFGIALASVFLIRLGMSYPGARNPSRSSEA